MAVKFYLDKRPNKTGEVHIRVSISIKGTRLMSTAGLTVSPDAWDQTTQKVLPKYINEKGATTKIINDRLKMIKSTFDAMDILATARPTADQLQKALSKITGSSQNSVVKVKDNDVLTRFEEFVAEESARGQWTEGTLQCWNAFRQHLKAQTVKGKLMFSHFNEKGLQQFIDYLRLDKQMEEKTVQKHYANMKWFLGWAIRQGYCTDTSIQKFRPKFKVIAKPVIFLTKDELMKVYRYEVPANGTEVKLKRLDGTEYTKTVELASSLEKARDLFCFCAFTSLRYSDMAKVKRTDIVGDLLNTTTQKTNDKLVINLNDYAKEILKKYEEFSFPDNLALPVISNQKMNDYIKDLCELCEITEPITRVSFRGGERVEETSMKWELVGTHAGRRTFICYALASGVPPETVMKWTGHSDYKAMKPYIDVSEKTKVEAMEKINKELKIS